MEIQSEPARGTRVRLYFPACAPLPRSSESDQETPKNPGQSALNVLLVDDDELIQCAIQLLLEGLGHSVTVVSSGETALAAIESGLAPAVVILDLNMPGTGGEGALPRLRALNPTVPILLSTGRVDQFALDLSRLCPHVRLWSKPFSMDELKQCLDSIEME